MPITDIFQLNKIKADLEQCRKENESLRKVLSQTEKMTIVELQAEIQKLNAGVADLGSQKNALEDQLRSLKQQIENKRKESVDLDDDLLMQTFGFYKPKYALKNSEQYKHKIEEIRDKQEAMVKADVAVTYNKNWQLNGSVKEGAKMMKEYVKLFLRSFNNECEASIINVKFNNVDTIEKKIRKAHEVLNHLGERTSISISIDYLNLKLQELYLCYEYQVKKQEEKEEQKRLKEQMREEAKLMKEIEEEKLRIEKEQKHFNQALVKLNDQISRTQNDVELQALEEKKQELEKRVEGLKKDMLNVENRELNTRAGYVYIISNIGSFGENVHKIGVTRRLEPAERIDELGDASVPFDFDIHAMIFSEDAPKLENALHKAFDRRKLNLINDRREFFFVTLDEIESEVKKNFNKTVEFIRVPEAGEFRESKAIREKRMAEVNTVALAN